MATTTDFENVRAAIIFAFADALRTVREHEERGDSDDGEAINAALGIAKGLGWDWEKDENFLSWCLKATEQEICVEGMVRALQSAQPAAFNPDGTYDVSSAAKRTAAMESTLRSIAVIPQAYHSHGPEVVVGEMQRSAVETLRALAPVEIARCSSCKEPAHPAETDDEDNCERCRTGAPHRAPQRCEYHDDLFEACACPACEWCCGFGCQSCGWTGRLLCEHCGRPRVGDRDECGGIGEGVCEKRAAAEDRPASDPRPSIALDACFFCHNAWGSCTCRWGDDENETIGFDFDDMFITKPNVSVCGRFFVNPETYYGNSYKRWAAKR